MSFHSLVEAISLLSAYKGLKLLIRRRASDRSHFGLENANQKAYENGRISIINNYQISSKKKPKEYLEDLGRKLYTKITEVMQAEIESINEEDCIKYIYDLVISRTFEGYQTERDTIYEQLQRVLGIRIEAAPDEWDRIYNVDFYIEVNSRYIGLQIKPITYEQTPEVHKWKEWLSKTHDKFEKDKGGKVFIVFSVKEGNKKKIHNQEVIDEIKKEIKRLNSNAKP